MSVTVNLILIQNLFLMFIVTCSISIFCAGKSKKGDKKTVEKPEEKDNDKNKTTTTSYSKSARLEDEKVKPPTIEIQKPRKGELPGGNADVDGEGYIRNEQDAEDLGTFKYLQNYQLPQTGIYSEEEIKILEEREIRLNTETGKNIREERMNKED